LEAEKHVQITTDASSETNNDNDKPFGGMHVRDVEVANHVMESLRIQIRGKKVELQAKAASIIDSCITITSGSISVRTPTSTNKNGESLDDAFNALVIISSLSDQKKDKDGKEWSEYNVGNNGLEDALQVVADNLTSIVLKPQISKCEECLKKTGTISPSWQLRESTTTTAATLASSISTNSKGGSIVTLEWRFIEEESTGKFSTTWWVDLLKLIQSIMTFVCERLFSSQKFLCQKLGRFLFGDVSFKLPSTVNLQSLVGNVGDDHSSVISLLSRLMWNGCIPEELLQDPSTLQTISKELRQCTVEFENNLLESGFLASQTALSDYAKNIIRTYTEKQRSRILAQGRNLLLQNDYNNTAKVGIDINEKRKQLRPEYMEEFDKDDDIEDMAVFCLHQCSISNVALDLMQLCQKTMDEAVDPRWIQDKDLCRLLPPTLYRVSRELLDLFRAIIPAVHQSEIASTPRTAAVLHNDCVFFAHKLLTFGLKYRDRFPTVPDNNEEEKNESFLKKLCTFVDLVPIFRELAEKTMVGTIQQQEVQLSEIICPHITYMCQALGSSEAVVEWTDTESALTAGLYHIRHASQAWKSILSHDIYGRTMGCLVDKMFSLFLNEVLKAKDISEPACHFVSALFHNAISGATELFEPSSMSPSPEEATKEFMRFCKLSNRFNAVGKFMDMSLANITMSLSEGTFRSVTGPELSNLIVAVFEDSEKRHKLLSLLASEATK